VATQIIAPQSSVVLVEALEEITAIIPQKEAVVVEVRRGPAGPTGATGPVGADGHDGTGDFPDGTATGDIIRWNAATGDWESCAEPFEFKGIVLVPMALPGGVVPEGFVGYNAVDKGVYIQVD